MKKKFLSAVLPSMLLGYVANATESSAIPAALPTNCTALDATHIQCVVHEYGIASGTGKWFGPYHALSSEAPAGYSLVSAEGHIYGEHDHKCGVRDQGSREPSPPGNSGEHPEVNGHPTGDSYWAICYLAERDTKHVLMRVSLQGVESQNTVSFGNGQQGIAFGSTNPLIIKGNADLTAIYVIAP